MHDAICVVTANIGGIDVVTPPVIPCRFRLFTERDVVPDLPAGLTPRLHGKYIKMMMHKLVPGYAGYLWLDASIELVGPALLGRVAAAVASNSMFVLPHPQRDTVAAELAFVRPLANSMQYLRVRYRPRAFDDLSAFFDAEGMNTATTPLYAMYGFGRPNTDFHNKIAEVWWELSRQFTTDQMLMAYLIWKHGISTQTCTRAFVSSALRFHRHIRDT